MKLSALTRILVVLALSAFLPGGAQATDVDGPNDCTRIWSDFGDAPEGFDAYPGITGRFPTCLAVTGPSTQTALCPAPGTPPGAATGYVRHAPLSQGGFWLGCGPVGGLPMGVDSEPDAKTSPNLPTSFCSPTLLVDCIEAASWASFGQDECFGSDDAGLVGPTTFVPCTPTTLSLRITSCQPRDIFLNVLVDWNGDGDWNDAEPCPTGGCAPEWAIKNAIVTLTTGCNPITTGSFLVGRGNAHHGAWLRITVTPTPVTDDFPWAGSAFIQEGFRGGETEDYPVTVAPPDPCDSRLEDWGDAPEEINAYPGVTAHFPTCLFDTGPGDQTIDCGTAESSFPGLTGYIRHITTEEDPHFWLGCGVPPNPPFGGIDNEINGKVSLEPLMGGLSLCNSAIAVDCIQSTPWGIDYGQDECYGDADAGIAAPPAWERCEEAKIDISVVNCETGPITVFLNILADWTHDGDWNDVSDCREPYGCAPEWALKNVPIILEPGCVTYTPPAFRVGTRPGLTWLRISLSLEPVNLDYPWAGSATMPNGVLRGGETEDYPIRIADGLIDAGSALPGQVWLGAPLPNPADGSQSIRYSLPQAGMARVGIYDVAGRLVRSLVRESKEAGEHTAAWDGRSDGGALVPAGIYLIRLEAAGQVRTQSATRLR